MVLRACDRCHSSKEKCVFGDDQQQCTRCRRLKITCLTSRRNRRLGRRPAAKAFPHGQMQVWSVESQQELQSQLPLPSPSQSQPQAKSPPEPQPPEPQPQPQTQPQFQTQLPFQAKQLQHPQQLPTPPDCHLLPAAPPPPPLTPPTPQSQSSPKSQYQFQFQFSDTDAGDTFDTYSFSGEVSDSPSLAYPEEESSPESVDEVIVSPERLLASPVTLRTTSDALRTVMDVEQFSVIHLPFMLGASFIPESQRTVYAILSLSGPTLTEGYLAFLGLMTAYQKSLVMRRDKPDMVKAAKGLQRLRSVTISHDYDAACALFLGQTMYVFNVLTADDSSTAHSIIRSSLMSARQWIPRLVHFPVMDTIIMTPLLIDTVECLVRREVPIIRLPHTDRIVIDRYAGLCATLLPLLYDLCECSHALKGDVLDMEADSQQGLYERLAEIEQSIIMWKPPTSPQLFTDFGEHEILAMVTQADVYRLAALLIVHRLRFPLGVHDETAHQLAGSIFAEMSFFAKTAAKQTTALPVVFPLTMAMLEIEGPGERLWEELSSFTVQSTSAHRLQGFIRQVRAARDSGFGGLWFELVDSKLRAAMPP